MPAGTKELRRRLISVRNTRKITYAMKLVSAAKLRKAQDAVVQSRQYTNAINALLRELIAQTGTSDFSHPLMERHHEVKTIRLLVAGGGRGLCGAYNTNVNKQIDAAFRDLKAANPSAAIEVVVLGKKPAEYLRRSGKPTLTTYENLSEDANQWPVDEVCRSLENDYISGAVDEVYMIYTHFKSAMSMTARCDRILPMDKDSITADTGGAAGSVPEGVTLFEPSVSDVFSAVIPRILRSRVRQSCLDAKASEQASRMTAMDAATKNAGDLIKKLQLAYNKLRQSGITAELLDIIGGAEAIS